jgi:hypothetical protein
MRHRDGLANLAEQVHRVRRGLTFKMPNTNAFQPNRRCQAHKKSGYVVHEPHDFATSGDWNTLRRASGAEPREASWEKSKISSTTGGMHDGEREAEAAACG